MTISPDLRHAEDPPVTHGRPAETHPGAQLSNGDEVVARVHLGGFVRRIVRRGTRGVVAAHDPDGTPRVAFSTGHVLRLDPTDVARIDQDRAG